MHSCPKIVAPTSSNLTLDCGLMLYRFSVFRSKITIQPLLRLSYKQCVAKQCCPLLIATATRTRSWESCRAVTVSFVAVRSYRLGFCVLSGRPFSCPGTLLPRDAKGVQQKCCGWRSWFLLFVRPSHMLVCLSTAARVWFRFSSYSLFSPTGFMTVV